MQAAGSEQKSVQNCLNESGAIAEKHKNRAKCGQREEYKSVKR